MSYLTIKEAASYLRCHRSLIFNLIRHGKLPSYKVGGKVLLKTEEVDAQVVPAAKRKSNNPYGPNGKPHDGTRPDGAITEARPGSSSGVPVL